MTCRTIKALKNLRIGALGARPTAFNTVRYSEKLLEQSGISIETLDLYELFGWVGKLKDNDAAVKAKLREIQNYVAAKSIPPVALLKMARFGVAVDRWMKQTRLNATAVQCWTAMEEFFGVVPCTLMSMMSNMLMSSACEVDIMGTVAMYAMAQASGRPSALVDWNNNYGEDPDKGVIFHCSNLPKDVFVREGRGQTGDGFPGNHRRHGRPGKHLRHRGGPREGVAVHLPAREHGRCGGQNPRLHRRRRADR